MRFAIAAYRGDDRIGYVALSTAKSGGFHISSTIGSAYQCSESAADHTIEGLRQKRSDLRFEKVAALAKLNPEDSA